MCCVVVMIILCATKLFLPQLQVTCYIFFICYIHILIMMIWLVSLLRQFTIFYIFQTIDLGCGGVIHISNRGSITIPEYIFFTGDEEDFSCNYLLLATSGFTITIVFKYVDDCHGGCSFKVGTNKYFLCIIIQSNYSKERYIQKAYLLYL